MEIKAKKLHPNAVLPSYALAGDAGMDLRSLKEYVVKPGQSTWVETGVALEFPNEYAALIWDKGGVAKREIKTIGGVFDANYRGDYSIGLVNLGKTDYVIKKGDKIAQVLVQKIERPTVREVTELSESERGEKRFGSTGKR
ncbi:MAG: dUTP diphosphatase [Patescibacteria group bacterium]